MWLSTDETTNTSTLGAHRLHSSRASTLTSTVFCRNGLSSCVGLTQDACEEHRLWAPSPRGSDWTGPVRLVVAAQSLSCVGLFMTPWTAACQASLSSTISQSLLKLISIELVIPSNHLILCLSLLLLPSIFPSIMVFSNELALRIKWPKYWSFSFSISLSNEYSGLISFRIDWLDLLAVQGTTKSLLQHYSSKELILWHSTFLWSNSHISTWLLEKI